MNREELTREECNYRCPLTPDPNRSLLTEGESGLVLFWIWMNSRWRGFPFSNRLFLYLPVVVTIAQDHSTLPNQNYRLSACETPSNQLLQENKNPRVFPNYSVTKMATSFYLSHGAVNSCPPFRSISVLSSSFKWSWVALTECSISQIYPSVILPI